MDNETKKIAIYTATFNPPNINHFVEISKLLSTNDEVYIFPIVSVKNKFYQRTPSYGKRLKMLSVFLSEFFPKIKDELVLVDTKSEMVSKNNKISYLKSLSFMKLSLADFGKTNITIHFEDVNEEKDIVKARSDTLTKIEDLKIIYDTNNNVKDIRKILNKAPSSIKKSEHSILNYNLGHHLSKLLIENGLYKIHKSSKSLYISKKNFK